MYCVLCTSMMSWACLNLMPALVIAVVILSISLCHLEKKNDIHILGTIAAKGQKVL